MNDVAIAAVVAGAVVAYSIAHRALAPRFIPNRPELPRVRYRTSLVTWIETGGGMPVRSGWGVCRKKWRQIDNGFDRTPPPAFLSRRLKSAGDPVDRSGMGINISDVRNELADMGIELVSLGFNGYELHDANHNRLGWFKERGIVVDA